MTARIGWVVDAQVDFMRPEGRLYVRDLRPGATDQGAVRIIPALTRTVQWMRRHCALVVFTGDAHAWGDREIDAVAPDPAKGTFPPHCMALSDDPAERLGADVLPGLGMTNPVVVPRDATPAMGRALVREALAAGRPLYLQKDTFSVFEGNPATTAILEELQAALGPLEIVTCGVATDVCVTAAVDGMAARGHRVAVVLDAIHGLGLEPATTTLARWRAAGVRVTARVGLFRGGRVA